MNHAQRFFKNSAALFLARLVNLVGNLLMVVWVSRSMGVIVFGSYSAALGLFALFQIAVSLGFENLIPREVGRDISASGRLFVHSILVAGIAAFVLTGVMDGSALVFHYTNVTIVATWIVSSAVFPTGIIGVLEAFFVALGHVEYVGGVYLLEVIGRLVATIFVLAHNGDVLSVVAIYAAFRWLASLLLFGSYIHLTGRPKWHIESAYLKTFARQLWTFSLITILASIFWNVDIITLSIFQNEYQLGVYNAAYKLVLVWSIIPTSYMGVALPILSRLHTTDLAHFASLTARSLRYLLAVALPLSLIIAIFSDQIITSVYGSDFVDSITVLRLLGWLLLPLFLNNVLYRVLISSDQQSRTLKVTIAGLIINIGLCLVLVPRHGAAGAALASLIAISTTFALNAVLVWRSRIWMNFQHTLWRFAVAAGLAVVINEWLRPSLSWMFAGILFVLVYMGGAVVIHAIEPSDWTLIRRLITRPAARGEVD